MKRSLVVDKFKVENRHPENEWDLLIIGGGATGLGIALDASLRGLKTILLERGDFASETSSNSTKLSHGGVRYLKTLEFKKILESSKEQLVMKTLAPHLVNDVEFFLPAKNIVQLVFYRIGFFIFDFLSLFAKLFDQRNSAESKMIFQHEIKNRLPSLNTSKSRFGIKYRDCQFDDARFALELAKQSLEEGAIVLNYFNVERILKEDGGVKGVVATDLESGESCSIRAKVVVNATGPFSDSILKKDDKLTPDIIKPLKGIHLVLPREFLDSDTALIVPETSRKRVFYVIPWHGRVLVGTTETLVDLNEGEALRRDIESSEIKYLLEEFAIHFTSKPAVSDVLSAFSGIRPIVQSPSDDKLTFDSRDHSIFISESGLVTIAGGKWTTYRRMAIDVVDQVMISANFIKMPSRTSEIVFASTEQIVTSPIHLRHFGSRAKDIELLENENEFFKSLVDERLPLRWSWVYWAIHFEFAVHLEDVLIRRSRSIILNADATFDIARPVAEFMAKELGKDEKWVGEEIVRFEKNCAVYRVK